jgi:DNA-binding IclR family transcriptional regulator
MSPGSGLGGRQPQAVRCALEVLRTVAQAGPGITAKEISTRLQLPPATTYRLLNLLVGDEYLVRLPDLTGFALGARFAELIGFAAASHLPPVAGAQVAAEATEPRPAHTPTSVRRKEIA